MKDNRNDKDYEQRRSDEDQLRPNTMNEAIREASGDRDIDPSDRREADEDIEGSGDRRYPSGDVDMTQGVGYTPNDASGVRSGGIADMDDQTAGGAGLNTGVRKGLGSHLNTKKGVSGSDYDGQNATS